MPNKFPLCASLALFFPYMLFANPEGATIVHGQAHLQNEGNTLQIETSPVTIIDWKNFSIGSNETTRFVQPDVQSSVLNRVTGGEISRILGKLEANGKVILINPQGVVIGKEAVIHTGGFIASTLDLSNEQFLNHPEWTFEGKTQASVINYGVIQARDQDVALFGYRVENQGDIRSPKGEVLLGSGEKILLKPLNTEEKFYILPSSASLKMDENAGIDCQGTIAAIRAELKADGNLHALAINQEGMIQARGIVERDGHLYLVAENGRAQTSGKMEAKNIDGKGGEIRILGEEVIVQKTAALDVSGDFGGGKILLGGDYQGKNPQIPNSKMTIVEKDAVITADAKIDGLGGTVILWSDQNTQYYNWISARGGEQGGDGGFVEVSSKGFLSPAGFADLRSPKGTTGMLFLDPAPVTISTANTRNVTFSGNDYKPSASSGANIKNSDLVTQLGMSNVTISSANTGFSQVGDITINAAIVYNSPNTLSFNAAGVSPTSSMNGSIFVNAPIINTSGTDGFINFISANNISVNAVEVSTTGPSGINMTAAGSLTVSADNYVNSAEISAPNGPITMDIQGNINLNAKGNLSNVLIEAGKDLTMTTGGNFAADTGTSGKVVVMTDDGNINMNILGNFDFPISNTSGNGIFSNATLANKDIRILTGGNFTMTVADTNSFSPAGGIIAAGTLTLSSGRDVFLSGSSTAASPSLAINFKEQGFLSSNQSMTLKDHTVISPTVASATVLLVVDAANPKPTTASNFGIGTGAFTIDATSSILSGSGGTVRIFTAKQEQNSIDPLANLNGSVFVAGPFNTNSATEIWSTYFPSTQGGTPFTIFYKEPSPTQINEAVNIFNIAYTEGPVKLDPLGTVTVSSYDVLQTTFGKKIHFDPLQLIPNNPFTAWLRFGLAPRLPGFRAEYTTKREMRELRPGVPKAKGRIRERRTEH